MGPDAIWVIRQKGAASFKVQSCCVLGGLFGGSVFLTMVWEAPLFLR